jgi:hypothetical protein
MYDWGALQEKTVSQLDKIIIETEQVLYEVEVERATKINKILYLQQRTRDIRNQDGK